MLRNKDYITAYVVILYRGKFFKKVSYIWHKSESKVCKLCNEMELSMTTRKSVKFRPD